ITPESRGLYFFWKKIFLFRGEGVSSVTLKLKDVSGGPAKNISSSESELRSENNPHGGRESGEERGEGDGDVDCIGPHGVAVSHKLCLLGLEQAVRGMT